MTTADFYVGLGSDAEWLGSLSLDGGTADMDEAGLFGPAPEGDYTEATFRQIVQEVLVAAVADEYGYSPTYGDMWPWPYPDSSRTDMVYVWKNGCIHVFEHGDGGRSGQLGQYLVALHYPNGARKPTEFPAMARG